MSDIRGKYVPPSVTESAFNCPHCGTLTTQYWYSVHADYLSKGEKPYLVTEEEAKDESFAEIQDPEERQKLAKFFGRLATGRPFVSTNKNSRDHDVQNVWLSECFDCDEISIWIYDRLIWPVRAEGTQPNPDLPHEVLRDYEEAGAILNFSPRSAAALLRLGVQKLCKHLGESGENINQDIASLVRKGLDPRVQQALDIVRVIGNNAVHPGQIDLRDDRGTAEKLFGLVNLIAEIMISQPKHVDALYGSLPQSSREAIEKRDGKK